MFPTAHLSCFRLFFHVFFSGVFHRPSLAELRVSILPSRLLYPIFLCLFYILAKLIACPTLPGSTLLSAPYNLQSYEKRQWVRVKAYNVEALVCRLEEFLPLTERPLLGAKQRHHPDVRRRAHLPDRARQVSLGRVAPLANVLDEDDASARFQGGDESPQDFDGLLVGPVVQDQLDQVDVGLDGLRVEEVVWDELDAGLELLGDAAVEFRLGFGEVLDGDG